MIRDTCYEKVKVSSDQELMLCKKTRKIFKKDNRRALNGCGL